MQPIKWQIILWPPVTEPEYIERTIWMGYFAAMFYSVIWGLIMIGGVVLGVTLQNPDIFQKTPEALGHLVIALFIGVGIFKRYKIAAIAGLSLSVIGFIWSFYTRGFIISSSVQWIAMTWVFIQSTRGVFAYCRSKGTMILDEDIKKA